MGQKIVVGPIDKGLRTDRLPFNIDNDSFPILINAYQWRGRVKRKRGTTLLNRLERFFNSTNTSYSSFSTITLTFSGGIATGNVITGFNLQSNSALVPGTISITDTNTGNVYTDSQANGILVGNPVGNGTINYASGLVTLVILGPHLITAQFNYYPDLPVMGLEDLMLTSSQYPGTLAFDTTYSYNILTTTPYNIYDVSFYKNPPAFAGYTPKPSQNPTPTSWDGMDYQQFWTVNYQGALWATNGINIPFSITNIGMQYAPMGTITVDSQTSTTLVLTITNCPLIIGDFVFVNEFNGSSVANSNTLNFQTGFVTDCNPNTPPLATKTLTITFPNANIATDTYSPGIVQYLTNRSDPTKDCLRWYDGDPTNSNPTNPTFVQGFGWVNFAPPLSQLNYSISDLPLAKYYLVGARMIIPFKDRLIFLGPVVQTSSAGSQVYLQDTIIYSQNGTPYYTASFSGTFFNPTNIQSLLVPTNQTGFPTAYWEDQTGFGGFLSAGVSQQIITASSNEDALIVGFSNNLQTRIIYTGNDIVPFNFFIINAELSSSSTFSAVNMDYGVLTRGSRGFIITNQTESKRFDLSIPDQVFQISLQNNGAERFCSARDFINEWVYFTYPSMISNYIYPNQTLLFNYRDNSWSIFNENYTTYGQFRETTGLTWATLPENLTWATWNDPWNSGSNNIFQPIVIAGNQQGFVMIREDEQTDEDTSIYIQSISGTQITSPNHCLNNGDNILITGIIGTFGYQLNNQIFTVFNTTTNTFNIDSGILTGSYIGGGLITRYYAPFIQTKQFPVAWNIARKTRIGPQQYLLTKTELGQMTLLIYLSQDSSTAYNTGNIIPLANVENGSLIYSTLLYTCPESTNLGLTPANINLQMITYPQTGTSGQSQIWHRVNTSLIGDTVQLAFTISSDQMAAYTIVENSFSITGATQANPCVLTCALSNFSVGQLVQISGVQGMTELNFSEVLNNYYYVISSNSTTVTISVDSTAFTAYTSGGIITPIFPINQTSEVELHGFVIDVQPSQVLA